MSHRFLLRRLSPSLIRGLSPYLLRPSPCPSPSLIRHFASSPLPRRLPRSRPPSVDIGARARRLQSRRLWGYAAAFSCVAGFVIVVLNNFQDALVFYITPSEALDRFSSDPSRNRFRLGGLVLEGSVSHPSVGAAAIEFVVTDLLTDVLVRYDGSLPDLFREGHSVVVEGFLKPLEEEEDGGGSRVSEKARGAACYFEATEVLAKHDEKYMPKEVGEALERNRRKIEAEAHESKT